MPTKHPELINLLEKKKNYCIKWMGRKLRKTHTTYKGKTWTLYVPRDETQITPALLVAHIDTVGRAQPVVKESRGVLYSGNDTVLGGDDRAGVYIIGEIATRLQKPPYVLLCDLEESGMIGAGDFADTGLLEALRANVYVEYDRQGISEYVTYLTPTNSDIDIIMKFFGYHKESGTFSDVLALSRRTGIAHVNVAAAYRGQHTTSETVSLAGIDFALAVGPDLITTLAKKERTCSKTRSYWGTYGSGYAGHNGGNGYKGDRAGGWLYDSKSGEWSKIENEKTKKKESAKECKEYIGYTAPYKNRPAITGKCEKCNTLLIAADDGKCPFCHTPGYTRYGSNTCLVCGTHLYPEDKGKCAACQTVAMAAKHY